MATLAQRTELDAEAQLISWSATALDFVQVSSRQLAQDRRLDVNRQPLRGVNLIQRLFVGLNLRLGQFAHRLSLASSARAGTCRQARARWYLAELAGAGLKAATIARRLVVISQAHKAADLDKASPTTSSLVRRTHAGIRRSIGTAQAARAPTVVSDLKRMVHKLPNTRVALRDRPMLLLGFAGAFRRSELVALDVADVEFSSGGLVVTLRRAKNDQEARGRRIGVSYGSSKRTCPVRSL